MEKYTLSWKYGSLEVQTTGCMIGPVFFKTENGKEIQPFHIAPWGDEQQTQELEPILKRSRGEWPCVPFGAARKIDQLRPDWERCKWETSEDMPHGPSSNMEWKLKEQTKELLTFILEYPANHDVKSLTRIIKPDANGTAIDFELQVEVRRNTKMPIGLHPTFRLSPTPLKCRLQPSKYKFGITFPGNFEPGSYLLEPNALFASLNSIPAADHTQIDLSRLPLPQNCENLVQLCGIEGSFELINNEELYTMKLEWNKEHYPSCILWMSNRGRSYYPWNSRNLCLGIEPVNAAFDLGNHVSLAENPIHKKGISTAMEFRAGEIWKTNYRMSLRQN